jgi:Holliday junction resolvase RusA-like endonuclease
MTLTARTAFGLPGRHLVTLEVVCQPASYSTAATAPWKDAVRAAVAASGVASPQVPARFAVGIAFRTPAPLTGNHVWDLDNLIKPTLDALEGIFGLRQWKGPAQAADDRVEHLTASKRRAEGDESTGATITVHVLQA